MYCGIPQNKTEATLKNGDAANGRPLVVHLTAHLGGGIGRVLSRVSAFAQHKGRYRHEIICLEQPEKTSFMEFAQKNGVAVHVAPETTRIVDLCASAAIVQFDWWHHPLMAHCLTSTEWPPLRSVVWAHISGMSPPFITEPFVALPYAFVVSTPYSLENPDLRCGSERKNLMMIHSSGGFDDLPEDHGAADHPFTVGYVGTLNFSKLHPEYIAFCSAAEVQDAHFLLVGDETTRTVLEEQARARGIAARVHFAGYVDPIWRALREIDVLAYLLNPDHYGTTENALLEAMAFGIPPIVLDQCAEKYLVRHAETGMIVRNKHEFGKALRFLRERPDERRRLGCNAQAFVKKELSCVKTVERLHACYDRVMGSPKQHIDFKAVFGKDPAEWFVSCLGPYRRIYENADTKNVQNQYVPSILFEQSKSSAYHFLHYFPHDVRLRMYAEKSDQMRNQNYRPLRT